MMELLQSLPFVKATPARTKAKPKDETEYLLSNSVNARELLESIEQIRQGQTVQMKELD